MAEMKDQVKGGIDNAAERAKTAVDGMKNVVDRAGECTSQARDKVREWAGEVGDAAKEAGQRIEHWADEAYETAADKVGSFGNEVTTLIRNHPIPAILIGLGVGVLLGRTARML